ncbi:MAG: hypothetical protein HS124_13310 [Anaerolineales bacterium]|nr:hypothetical protein [Anaerolineales bacterium]MCL4261405.1 hypothetical protein [Anaerolineales bacterium]
MPNKEQQTIEVEGDSPAIVVEDNMTFQDQAALFPVDSAITGELERVRDLLFGKQTKAIDRRLAQLETRIEVVQTGLTDLVETRIAELGKSFAAQFEALRKEALDHHDRQTAKQTTELQSAKQSLVEHIDAQEKDQTEKLRSVQRMLSERIDSLANASNVDWKKARQEISAQIEILNSEQGERITRLQQETSQHNDALRNELIVLGKTLGNQKVSRREMMQLLVELAQQLQGEDSVS